jgi:hypothetical protein
MYNFGILSFLSFNTKSKVISKLLILEKCPLLILNSNFKIHFEFKKVFNTKLVELEILKISYLGNFSSHYMILRVISNLQFGLCSGGRCYSVG